jgi:YfiH family protein
VTARVPEFRAVDLGQGIIAGFTTRHGGVSPAPWDSLNLAADTGDDPDRVNANRARLRMRMAKALVFVKQEHGTVVHVVSRADREAFAVGNPPMTLASADAMVTTTARVGLGVLTADCAPILLSDPVARVVGAAHAGREGVRRGVVDAVLRAMYDAGATAIRAAIGPAICGRCYEVPAAMRDEVAAAVPETYSTTVRGTPALDLPAGIEAQLRAGGVGMIEHSRMCTLEDHDYFSHRRAGGEPTGRQAGIIALV